MLLGRIPGRWRKPVEWLMTIGLAVGFVLVFEAEVAKPFRIPSPSMERTLNCARPVTGCRGSSSDRVLVDRLAYDFGSPQRGQMVVFTAPARASSACGPGDGGATFIKRLIGLPGDTVTERNGFISIDGRQLREPYVTSSLRDHGSGTWHVPRGEYFFLGDNRANSCDSRAWGFVPRSSLIGPVIARYWPPDRITFWSNGF